MIYLEFKLNKSKFKKRIIIINKLNQEILPINKFISK